MSDISLERRKVTAFGIEWCGHRFWHRELADRVGDTVYVYPKNGLPANRNGVSLLVFDAEPSRICEATPLENPHRLLRCFDQGFDPLAGG